LIIPPFNKNLTVLESGQHLFFILFFFFHSFFGRTGKIGFVQMPEKPLGLFAWKEKVLDGRINMQLQNSAGRN